MICTSFLFAETVRFELTIPFWSIHTFQACSFDHSDTSPLAQKTIWNEIRKLSTAILPKGAQSYAIFQ